MKFTDLLTLIIAVWGAVLSTILFYREFLKDRRSLSVFIDHIHFYEAFQLRILNTNQRPITMAGVEVYFYSYNGRKKWEDSKSPLHKFLNGTEEDIIFPITLDDGEHKIIKLPENLNKILLETLTRQWKLLENKSLSKKIKTKAREVEIYVLDIEGRKYLAKKGHEFNPHFDQIIE